MDNPHSRRSDRIYVELPIEIAGEDIKGEGFVEKTHTLLISCHGAKIFSTHDFVPEQELNIRYLETAKEASGRVIGLMKKTSVGSFYGVAFGDEAGNIWGIEFPPLSESEKALHRICLECLHCHGREVVYLNEFEAEVYAANSCLSRSCKRCRDLTVWKNAQSPVAYEEKAGPISPHENTDTIAGADLPTKERRKHRRIKLKQKACISSQKLGDEVIFTEDVSRGGLSFMSPKQYAVGLQVDVALPYSQSSLNIFFPARIVRSKYLPGEGLTLYGVAYIPAKKKWPRGQ